MPYQLSFTLFGSSSLILCLWFFDVMDVGIRIRSSVCTICNINVERKNLFFGYYCRNLLLGEVLLSPMKHHMLYNLQMVWSPIFFLRPPFIVWCCLCTPIHQVTIPWFFISLSSLTDLHRESLNIIALLWGSSPNNATPHFSCRSFTFKSHLTTLLVKQQMWNLLLCPLLPNPYVVLFSPPFNNFPFHGSTRPPIFLSKTVKKPVPNTLPTHPHHTHKTKKKEKNHDICIPPWLYT